MVIQSEYLCPCDERVQFLSGFSGSNAIALISQEEALLWTDGRYFLQAEKELAEGWSMRKMIESEKKWFEHIAEKYPAKSKIEIDGRLISAGSAQDRKKYLEEKDLVEKIDATPQNGSINFNKTPNKSQTIKPQIKSEQPGHEGHNHQ